jgi:hypothetical protein
MPTIQATARLAYTTSRGMAGRRALARMTVADTPMPTT